MTRTPTQEDKEAATRKSMKDSESTARKRTKNGRDLTNICPISPPKSRTGRVIAMTDTETGEPLGFVLDGGKAPDEGDWIKLMRTAALMLARDAEFGAETRVLMFLMGNIQFGNFVATSATLIAEDLGVNRKTVTRVVGHLLDQGLIQRDTLKGIKGYRFNPNLMFKGKPQLQGLQIHEWNRRMLAGRDERDRAEAELEAAFDASRCVA